MDDQYTKDRDEAYESWRVKQFGYGSIRDVFNSGFEEAKSYFEKVIADKYEYNFHEHIKVQNDEIRGLNRRLTSAHEMIGKLKKVFIGIDLYTMAPNNGEEEILEVIKMARKTGLEIIEWEKANK